MTKFIFVFIILLYFPNLALSMDGICTKMVRVSYTRQKHFYRSYVHTYKERCRLIFKCKKSRIAYQDDWRTVTDYKTETRQFCCTGYTQDESSEASRLVCMPVCTPPCVNSQCVKPNTCTCNPGHVISDEWNLCNPHCNSDCFNGRCSAPDTCTCNFGFTAINTICTPICEQACVNATCTAPDTCSCLPGYRSTIDSKVCAPYCSSGCLNGVCVSPEICECDTGYEHLEGKCVPICDDGCGTGKCTAPGICACDEGHELNADKKCAPHCYSCEHGDCVAPGMCDCHTGYNLTQLGICEPICQNSCKNGVCSTPNVCKCNEGYSKILDQCHPLCDECVNGYCHAPQQCKCFEGYSEKNKTHCSPICEPACDEKQNCKGPNLCDCLEGYKEINGSCTPLCKDCKEICVAPDVCRCQEGYKFTHSSGSENECMPLCDECFNGSCIAPGLCQCEKNYILVNGSCVPVCDNCIHGVCIATDVCECMDGYSKNFEGFCEKNCPDCDNGTCVATRQCECLPGFEALSQEGPCVSIDLFKLKSTRKSSESSEVTETTIVSIPWNDVEINEISPYETSTKLDSELVDVGENKIYSKQDNETANITAQERERKNYKEGKRIWIYIIVCAASLILIPIAAFATWKCVKYFRGSYVVGGTNPTQSADEIEIMYSSSSQVHLQSLEQSI